MKSQARNLTVEDNGACFIGHNVLLVHDDTLHPVYTPPVPGQNDAAP